MIKTDWGKFYSIDEIKNLIQIDSLTITKPLFIKACKEFNFLSGGVLTLFINPQNIKNEETEIHVLARMLGGSSNLICIYEKLNKPHTTLTYYRAAIFRSEDDNDMLNIKKIFKFNKLKAFI